jgi:hypothetical protein
MTFGNRLRVVTLAVFCSVFAAGLQAADVNVVGVWKGTMDSQMGAVDNTITIDTASPLAGKVAVGEYQGRIEKGTLDGEKIAFQITIEHGSIAYEGTVTGDEMKLTVTGTTGNKMALVAKRQK